MGTSRPPRSMRDFDYFDDDAVPAGWELDATRDELPEDLRGRVEQWRRKRSHRIAGALAAIIFFVIAVWFVWGFRDAIAYAFAAPRPPQKLGDVTTFTPEDIPTGAYVELTGITEHRGMSQKLVRGLGIRRHEYWYFRLLGSRGVFIEVPADPKRYGPVTKLTVSGRAVDPVAEPTLYGPLMAAYQKQFLPDARPALRIIQVGLRPGEGRAPYVVVFVLLGLLAFFNVWWLAVLLRAERRGPGRGLLEH